MAKMKSAITVLIGAFLGASMPLQAMAQATRPSLTMQGAAEPGKGPIFRDALGRPCLDVEAAARAKVINPDMLDHVISIKNNCPKLIKVKVCYFNSDRCNEFDIQPYKRVDTTLGTMKGVSFFRYSIFQR